jgi:GDP-4-dehydro-6-deoxy-D-mannose reductase
MSRAFITGVAGFAGSHLAEYLLSRGREVFGLTQRRPDTAASEGSGTADPARGLRLVEGDLLDGTTLQEALREIRPEEIYHLAAQSSVRASLEDPLATFRVNVLGTRALLEAARRSAARARLLCVSSAEAYGESARSGEPLDETRPLLPLTPYATSKAAGEQAARRYAAECGLDVVLVRPFPHTGPRHAPHFVYPDLAWQLCEIRAGRRAPEVQVGNLDVRRDLSDVRDVVAAYVLALEQGSRGAVYNVCSGRPVSLRQVLERLIELSGVTVRVAVQAIRRRPQDLDVLCGSAGALRERTGWEPRMPLETTLRDLMAYWESNARSKEHG